MANIKTYSYWPKQTSARTTYAEISEEDMAEIKAELLRWSAMINELDMSHDEDWRAIREQYFHRRRKDLPRGKEGENTPASFIGGMIMNTVYGTQRDFSDRQLEAIESISAAMNQLWDHIPAIRFKIGIFK